MEVVPIETFDQHKVNYFSAKFEPFLIKILWGLLKMCALNLCQCGKIVKPLRFPSVSTVYFYALSSLLHINLTEFPSEMIFALVVSKA